MNQGEEAFLFFNAAVSLTLEPSIASFYCIDDVSDIDIQYIAIVLPPSPTNLMCMLHVTTAVTTSNSCVQCSNFKMHLKCFAFPSVYFS